MDVIKMLELFAKEQGINKEEVKKFLDKFNNPKTLDDVVKLPYDLQNHYSFVVDVEEPLQSFIMDDWYDGQRYETLKVDRIVDCLYESVYDLLGDEIQDIDTIGFENLTTTDESKVEELERLKVIAKCIIDTKFGSAEIDW